jgi:hypothetical protein
MPRKGAGEKPWSPKSFQHGMAEARPPSQRTRQMEKDLERTLLKRYEEAKALEKKKKRSKRATMKGAALIGKYAVYLKNMEAELTPRPAFSSRSAICST